MNIHEFKLSKTLFAGYCGLVASGYEIGDKHYSALVKDIKGSLILNDHDIAYFQMARVSTNQINPYWPNGFLLTIGCLYLEHRGNLKDIRSFIQSNPELPSDLQRDEMVLWISNLPEVLSRLQNQPSFEPLWKRVNETVQLENHDVLLAIYEQIKRKMGDAGADLVLQVVINPLQAYEIADFLSIDRIKYLIMSQVHVESIVHEYFHIYFDDVIDRNRQVTEGYTDLLNDIYDEMYNYQYASDLSGQSWCCVFEENFVRAATIWFCTSLHAMDREQSIGIQEQSGFKYVRPIVSVFETQWQINVARDAFWSQCLEACRGVYNE